MKIIIIISGNPYFGNSASSNRWLTLIEGLSKLGVEIELYITGGYSCPTEFSQLGRKGMFKGIKYEYFSFLFHHNLWLRRLNVYALNRMLSPLVSFLVSKNVFNNKNAIIWTDNSYDSYKLAVSLKKKISGISTFLEISEFLDAHKVNKGNTLQKNKANIRQRFFEENAYYAYSGLALMTKTLYNHYKAYPKPGPKLMHLPMTVDLDRFNSAQTPLAGFKQPYIAFVGVMNDAKDGVSILIESFNLISKEYPELKLYLIGGWNYDTPIHQQLIKKYDLEDKVFWKGEFTRDQIPAIIKNASLLALPRPDSKQAQGGFPTKLGEYLATANPVCVTTVGEIPDYLVDGESVYFAEPGSVNSFADAMKRALSNPAEAKRIGANGFMVAEKHFNKEIQAKSLYSFLSSLANNNSIEN
jgi:glycosyltransferase involved in cell wall biosynthesis